MASLTLAVGGCDSQPAAEGPAVSFQAALTQDTIVLGEAAGDSLSDIGAVLELASGGLAVADRFRARLLLYSATGQLLGSYGRFGAGPGEFRGIDGVAEGDDGRLFVVDNRLDRVTVLEPGLAYAGAITAPFHHAGPVAAWDGRLVLSGGVGRRGPQLFAIDASGEPLWSGYAIPEEIVTQPYWAAFATVSFAELDSRLAVASGLLYPLSWIGPDGDVLGTFGTPPPSWRPIPPVERGAFVGGPFGARWEAWIASFTVVGGVYAVASRYVVVVHSRLESHPLSFVERRDYALDVYDRDGDKLLEDVTLPPGARVLAGGNHLWVLVSEPPEPWTLVRARPRGR